MCDVEMLELSQQQLLHEISSIIQSRSEPSDANALVLNQELQWRLEQVRIRIQALLKSVRARYARNEETLIRRLNPRHVNSEKFGWSGAVLRGGTFRFKGNLYFRDSVGRSCPNNEDYERRCTSEMFPTDFDMRSKHVWTLLDKKNLVMGVKQQLLDYMALKAPRKTGTSQKQKPIDQHIKSMASLLATVDKKFSIDWNQISTLDMDYRHSPHSCEAMWLVYLDPRVRRDEWTAEEDQALMVAAKANQMQNWQKIAATLDRRSDYQCFIRIHTTLRVQMEPAGIVKWTDEENERLKLVVQKNTVNGQIDWKEVMEHFPGRVKSSIIGRYTYVLHPSISHEPFSTKEDMMLFAAVEEYNGKFHCFPRTLFPNRSLTQLRTRYHNVLAQRNKTDPWSDLDDTKLMDFVTEHGPAQWVKCAAFLGNHTRTSCRTRFLTIKRFLERHPKATVEDFPRRRMNKDSLNPENWAQRLQEWQENPESLESPESKETKKRAPRSPRKRKRLEVSNLAFLKGIDLQVYQYFKYGYNLKLTGEPSTLQVLPSNNINVTLVAQALSYRQPVPIEFKPIQTVALPRELRHCYNKLLMQLTPNSEQHNPNILLPPNWSTMMGFRAICILSGHGDSKPKIDTEFSYDETVPAVQLFRQRLRALFYRTTLLSRLETQVFEELPAALVEHARPAPNYAAPKIEEIPKPPNIRFSNQNDSVIEVATNQLQSIDRLMEMKKKHLKAELFSEDEIFLKEEEFLSEEDSVDYQ